MARSHLSQRHRQQRVKNYAILIVLVSLCIIFYLTFITRAGLLG